MELNIKSGFRKHEEEHEKHAEEVLSSLNRIIPYRVSEKTIDTIARRVETDLKFLDFYEDPTSSKAYDIGRQAVAKLENITRSIKENILTPLEKASNTENKARDIHMITRGEIKGDPEKDAKKAYDRAIVYLSNKPEMDKSITDLTESYVVLQIVHKYLDHDRTFSDPYDKKYLNEITTYERIKNAVKSFFESVGAIIEKKEEINDDLKKVVRKKEQENKIIKPDAPKEEKKEETVQTNSEKNLVDFEKDEAERVLEVINKVSSASDKFAINKANFYVMDFIANAQALMRSEKVDLDEREKTEIRNLIDKINRAVEDKAKSINARVEYVKVDPLYVEASQKRIENLIDKGEDSSGLIYLEYVANIMPFSMHFWIYSNASSEWGNEWDEQIKRNRELAHVLSKRKKNVSQIRL